MALKGPLLPGVPFRSEQHTPASLPVSPPRLDGHEKAPRSTGKAPPRLDGHEKAPRSTGKAPPRLDGHEKAPRSTGKAFSIVGIVERSQCLMAHFIHEKC